MSRQHAPPVHIGSGISTVLRPVGLGVAGTELSEGDVQDLIHRHPQTLPIAEIDPLFVNPVSICRELPTDSGPIDNFLVTATGLPVLVECKLWRNAQSRREVVGQILDYAKEISRWSTSHLEAAVRRRLKQPDKALVDLVREFHGSVDDIAFEEALAANLRRGRFLLLIVGDGIRTQVELLAEYLQAHGGLHFSFGLVEFPIYAMPDGSRLVAPRVLARTEVITRTVVVLPSGFALEELSDAETGETAPDPKGDAHQAFWQAFIDQLTLDDPEQPRPNAARHGHISLSMPNVGGSAWLYVYHHERTGEIGLYLSSHRGKAGDFANSLLAEDWETLGAELGGTARLTTDNHSRPRVGDAKTVGSLEDPAARDAAFTWLAQRVNTFVTVLRPRIRSAGIDYHIRQAMD